MNAFNLRNIEHNRVGGLMDFIEINITHFSSYIKRSDIKTPTWFALDHDIVTHPDFFDINGDEFKAFIRIIGIATHLNCQTIRVYTQVVSHQAKVSHKSVLSCIEKLKGKRWDVTEAYGSVRMLTGNIGPTCPTGEGREEERSEGNILSISATTEFHPLAITWNQHCGELPKVVKVTEER